MSDEKKKKKSKKVIIKVLICFLVVMGILTFFSNTIMNMTLTQVSTQQVYSATLSSISRTSGTAHAYTEMEVKAKNDLTIGSVEVWLYQDVNEGDVLALLKQPDPEEQTELEQAKKELEEMEKQMSYEARRPSENSDFYDLEMSVYDAKLAVDRAQKDLENIKNKDKLISQTKTDISTIEGQITSLNKDKNALESKQQEAESQREMIAEEMAPYQKQLDRANEDVDDADMACENAKASLSIAQADLEACVKDPSNPAFDQDVLDMCTMAVSDAQMEVSNAQQQLKDARDRVNEILAEMETLTKQYNDADAKVNSILNQITDKDSAIEKKQEELEKKKMDLEEYEALPTQAEAERALKDAKHSLTVMEKSLSDAKINAGISSEQAEDSKKEQEKQLEELRKKVEKLEAQYTETEITAPISGNIIAINVERNGNVMKDEVMFVIADMDSGFYMECSVSKSEASNMYIGSEVKADYCDRAFVESMRPDPSNPMESMILRISLEAYYIQPGATTINCTISTSNRSYENVVPKGAVQQDSDGNFIYILVTKNSPLGERYIAKKVPVKILAQDATSCAIDGAGISYAYCIIRTEKPIENGEQVRLAQGEAN